MSEQKPTINVEADSAHAGAIEFTSSDQGMLHLHTVNVDAQLIFTVPIQPLPATVEINGVTYRREADWVDKTVNVLDEHRAVAERTGLTMQQVYFHLHGTLLPE